MSKNRIKVSASLIASRAEAEAVMTDLAAAVNEQRRVTAKRDAEVLAINEKYQASLGQIAQEIDACTGDLRAWLEANPTEIPKGRKSVEMTSGVLGFRTGTPKLSLLSRAWNWDKVLAALIQGGYQQWIREKQEINKDTILGQYSQGGLFNEDLARVGVKVQQQQAFFVEPNLSDAAARQTVTEGRS